MTRRRERRYRRWRNRTIRKWVRRWNADEDTTVGYRGRFTAADARKAWPYDPRECGACARSDGRVRRRARRLSARSRTEAA